MQPRMGVMWEGVGCQHHRHIGVTEIGLLVLNQFLIQTMGSQGFATRVLGSPWSAHFLRLKIATGWSQTVVNLDLLGPSIQIQFSTFIKKAILFTELLSWPVAHWGDTGHRALGQFDWVTSVSSSKDCTEIVVLTHPPETSHSGS